MLAGEGIYYAVASRQQVAVSCDEFRRARPASPRVIITGCDINFAGAGYRESSGQVEELYPAGSARWQSSRGGAVRRRDTGSGGDRAGPDGARRRPPRDQRAIARRHADGRCAVATDRCDRRLVRTGIIERLRSRRILSGLAPPIAENAPVVDLDGTPDFLTPGLAPWPERCSRVLAFWPPRHGPPAAAPPSPRRRFKRCRSVSNLRSLESSQHDPEHAFDELSELREFPTSPRAHSSAVALPRLLLLAIDVSSGPEAIESAPPLGSRADVAAMLRGVISDLTGDERQSLVAARWIRQSRSRALDPVPTVVVEARGEAGVALVKEVLLMTGWRAFAPKTGLFVGADDPRSAGSARRRRATRLSDYYGLPLLKPPVWTWEIPAYFFVGGAAGAAAVVGAVARVAGANSRARPRRSMAGCGRRRGIAGAPRLGPRPAGAVSQHAAGLQAAQPDVGRRLDARRVLERGWRQRLRKTR